MTSKSKSKADLPSCVAEILDEFKFQRSASRPRIGVGNRNYFLYGQEGTTLEDNTLHAVRSRLSFGSPQPQAETEEKESVVEQRQTPKRKCELVPQNYFEQPKRLAMMTPDESFVDWSPASKDQRSRLLEFVDSRITDLQSMVAKNEHLKRNLMEIMENEKQALQRQKERDKLLMKQLQEQMNAAKDRAFETEQELIKERGQLKELKLRTEQEIRKLIAEKSDLSDQLRVAARDKQEIQQNLQRQLDTLIVEKEKAQRSLDKKLSLIKMLEGQVESLRRKELREEALQESLAIANQRIQTLETELAEVKLTVRQQKEASNLSSATARRVKELEEQVTQGREMLRGKLLLEETVGTLRVKAASSSQLAEQLATQQEINKRREAELTEWHTMACQLVSGDAGSPSPRAVAVRAQQLEQAQVVLRADLNDAMSQLTVANQGKAEAEAELRSEQGRRQALQTTLDAQAANMKRMERKLQLITKERDSIQAVLKAYEGDMTMVGGQLNALQRARIESAESSAQNLRKMLEEREKELALAKGSPADPHGELASLQEKLQLQQKEFEKERAKNEALEERCERLELLLEQRALRGDYDPSRTKVLHYKMNPQAQETMKRNQEMERLKETADKLRERVRLLESAGTAGVLNTTSLVEENFQIQSNKELVELREQNKQLEIKSQRLVEVFKKTSTSFRNAIHALFGYKTDGLPGDTYRLASLYAEHEEDHLLFKIIDGKDIEIIQTAFSESIPELVQTHLQEQGSVPAFLSALTLELFSRQTFTS